MPINCQSELRSPSTGEPAPDGKYEMLLRICDVEFGSTPLWEEIHPTLYGNPAEVRKRTFSVLMGSAKGDPLDRSIFSGPDRWLKTRVATS